ncbi:uncharacterized protein V6R79_011996 [Siganus canaliculatus]
MAAMPLEVQLRCCICLHTYSDPVSIPCGHNFCMDCIESYWDTKDKAECPLCKQTFRQRPELRINRVFAELVDIFEKSQQNQQSQDEDQPQNLPKSSSQHSQARSSEGVVPCDVCRGVDSPSVKSCLVCQASYCQLHLAPHQRDAALQTHRLTDPATFPSSHLCRKHDSPLTMFCKREHVPVCVKCTEKDHKHHETVAMEKESKRVKAQLSVTKIDIQQLINGRLRKKEQIKNSLDLSKKIMEREIQGSAEVCVMMKTAIEKQQEELVEELKGKQEEAERRAEELLAELEEEIHQLQTRSSELQQLELTQSPLHLLQSLLSLSKLPSTKEWSEVAFHSDNCVGATRRAVSKFVDFCQELARKLSADEVEKMTQYAVDITLDPETASDWMILSPDRKRVSTSKQKRNPPLPNSPQRFDSCVCVLGKQSFTSGRRYWTVQVGDKTDWDLGVARESINRKGAITVRPDGGFWAICRRKGGSLSVCTSPSISLHQHRVPQKVGVLLDYEAGSVSFYDADAKTHIYSYSGCSFAEPLYPYFNPGLQNNGTNGGPLVIRPVEGRGTDGQGVTIEAPM